MAKVSLEDKIIKVQDAIAKEELNIEQSNKKLKQLKDDLKALEAEQYNNAMSNMKSVLKKYGVTPEQAVNLIIKNCAPDAIAEKESNSQLEAKSN